MKERLTGRAQGLSLASSAPSWFSKPSTLAKRDTAVTDTSTSFSLEPSKAFSQSATEAGVSFPPVFMCRQMKRLHVSRRPVSLLRTHALSSLGSFTPGAQPLPAGRQFSDLSLQLTQPPLPGALQARGSETHVHQPSPPSYESPGKSQPSQKSGGILGNPLSLTWKCHVTSNP